MYRASDDRQALQLYCEHAVGCVSPPGGRAAFDLEGLEGPVERDERGASPFALAREQHRELAFDDADALRRYVVEVWETRDARAVPFDASAAYALIRELRTDSAWESAFQQSPNRERWLTKL